MITRTMVLGILAGLAVCIAVLAWAMPDRFTRIKTGMNTDQVTAILGQPTSIEHAETTGLQGDVYHYPAPHGEGRVVFLNSTVFKAEFVPGAKS